MLKVRRRNGSDKLDDKDNFVADWLTSASPSPGEEDGDTDPEGRIDRILDELHRNDKVVKLRPRR